MFVKYLMGTFQEPPIYSILTHSGSSRKCDETEDGHFKTRVVAGQDHLYFEENIIF